jgi:hypothetical protein
MIDEFATVGLFNALPDTRADFRFLLDHTQGGLLHQLLGGRAAVAGDLRKLRFLFGSKLHYHNARTRLSQPVCQESGSFLKTPVLSRTESAAR